MFWAVAGIVLVLLLIFAFRPRPVPVDTAEVGRGALTVTVRDEGRTRAREVYVVSAPVSGQLLRIANRAGEQVQAGAVIASILPAPAALIDERTRRGNEAAVRSAEAALTLARAELDRVEAQLAHGQWQDTEAEAAEMTRGEPARCFARRRPRES